jgi:hypothetical protein
MRQRGRLRGAESGDAEFAAEVVFAENVVFEQDRAPRGADRGQPRVEVRARIDRQVDRVVLGQGCAGRAAECLFGEQA